MPVTALVTPGPEVTSATPTFCDGARIAVGRVHGALLVAHQDVLDLVLLEELVVDVEDRAAGIAEDVLDAFLLQAADDDLGAGKGAGLDSVHDGRKSLRNHDGNIADPQSPRRRVLATRSELSAFLEGVERRAFKQAVFAVRDEQAALDIVQDAMLRLAEKYGDRPAAELPLLFHRIVQNAIRDYYRRQKVRSLWTTLLPRSPRAGRGRRPRPAGNPPGRRRI